MFRISGNKNCKNTKIKFRIIIKYATKANIQYDTIFFIPHYYTSEQPQY